MEKNYEVKRNWVCLKKLLVTPILISTYIIFTKFDIDKNQKVSIVSEKKNFRILTSLLAALCSRYTFASYFFAQFTSLAVQARRSIDLLFLTPVYTGAPAPSLSSKLQLCSLASSHDDQCGWDVNRITIVVTHFFSITRWLIM